MGKRSHGAAWKRFPGERRTLTCSLHETKYQVDRARHDRHKLDRVRASRLAYSQLCWHATVVYPVGSWLCPLEKKCDVTGPVGCGKFRPSENGLAERSNVYHAREELNTRSMVHRIPSENQIYSYSAQYRSLVFSRIPVRAHGHGAFPPCRFAGPCGARAAG